MSSQRETVRRPKGGGAALLPTVPRYCNIGGFSCLSVSSPIDLSACEDVYICTYVDMYSWLCKSVSPSSVYSTGRLTWKMDPKVYLEVYYHLHFFTGKTQGIKLPVSMISMQTRSFARLY